MNNDQMISTAYINFVTETLRRHICCHDDLNNLILPWLHHNNNDQLITLADPILHTVLRGGSTHHLFHRSRIPAFHWKVHHKMAQNFESFDAFNRYQNGESERVLKAPVKKQKKKRSKKPNLMAVLLLVVLFFVATGLGLFSAKHYLVEERVHIRQFGGPKKTKHRIPHSTKRSTKRIIASRQNSLKRPSLVNSNKAVKPIAEKQNIHKVPSRSGDDDAMVTRDIGVKLIDESKKLNSIDTSRNVGEDDVDDDGESVLEDSSAEEIGCYSPYEFKMLENIDIQGGDPIQSKPRNGKNFEDCCKFCIHMLECTSFTFVPDRGKATGYCWLKTFDGNEVHTLPGQRIISGRLGKHSVRKKDSKLREVEGRRFALHPYTTFIRGNPPSGSLSLFGAKVTYGVAKREHLRLIEEHIAREKGLYKLLRRYVDTSDKHSIVVDVGANHGLYSIFAAAWGKTVIAIEPQQKLCSLINWSLGMNKIEKQVTLYNIAILNSREKVSMVDTHIAEGAVGMIQKESSGGVPAYLLGDVIPRETAIGFLKIDVEGSELAVLQSSYSLLDTDMIDNIVVEFGPPSRWMRALEMDSNEGFRVLQKMQKYDFKIRLLSFSQVFGEFSKSNVVNHRFFHELTDLTAFRALINSMNTCNCESYLWLARNPAVMDKVAQEGTLGAINAQKKIRVDDQTVGNLFRV
jgi:FkbM family methyltransferase